MSAKYIPVGHLVQEDLFHHVYPVQQEKNAIEFMPLI